MNIQCIWAMDYNNFPGMMLLGKNENLLCIRPVSVFGVLFKLVCKVHNVCAICGGSTVRRVAVLTKSRVYIYPSLHLPRNTTLLS